MKSLHVRAASVLLALCMAAVVNSFPFPVTLYDWNGSMNQDDGWIPQMYDITPYAANEPIDPLTGCFGYNFDRLGNLNSALKFEIGKCILEVDADFWGNLDTVGSSIMFASWFRDNSLTGSVYLFGNADVRSVDGPESWYRVIASKGSVGREYKDGPGSLRNPNLNTSFQLRLGVYFHIALTVQRTQSSSYQYSLYFDGDLVDRVTLNSNLLDNGRPIMINGEEADPFYRNILMDETALWISSDGLLVPDVPEIDLWVDDTGGLRPLASPYVTHSPSPSMSVSSSATRTVSRSASATRTVSRSASVTASDSVSPSSTGTSSVTASSSRTASSSASPSNSGAATPSATGTATVTTSVSPSASPQCANPLLRFPDCDECINPLYALPFCADCRDEHRVLADDCQTCEDGYTPYNDGGCDPICAVSCPARLNRGDNCDQPHTCGPCLPGYIPESDEVDAPCTACFDISVSVESPHSVPAFVAVRGIFGYVSILEECLDEVSGLYELTINWKDSDTGDVVYRRQTTAGDVIPNPANELTLPADLMVPNSILRYEFVVEYEGDFSSVEVEIQVQDLDALHVVILGGDHQIHDISDDLQLVAVVTDAFADALPAGSIRYYWSCSIGGSTNNCPYNTQDLMPAAGSATNSLQIPHGFPLEQGEVTFLVRADYNNGVASDTDNAVVELTATADGDVEIISSGADIYYYQQWHAYIPTFGRGADIQVQWSVIDTSTGSALPLESTTDSAEDSFMIVIPGYSLQPGRQYRIEAQLAIGALSLTPSTLVQVQSNTLRASVSASGRVDAFRRTDVSCTAELINGQPIPNDLALIYEFYVVGTSSVSRMVRSASLDSTAEIAFPEGEFTVACSVLSITGERVDSASVDVTSTESAHSDPVLEMYLSGHYEEVLFLLGGMDDPSTASSTMLRLAVSNMFASPESVVTIMSAMSSVVSATNCGELDAAAVADYRHMLDHMASVFTSIGALPLIRGQVKERVHEAVLEAHKVVRQFWECFSHAHSDALSAEVLDLYRSSIAFVDEILLAASRQTLCGQSFATFEDDLANLRLSVYQTPVDADNTGDFDTRVLNAGERVSQFAALDDLARRCESEDSLVIAHSSYTDNPFIRFSSDKIVSSIEHIIVGEKRNDLNLIPLRITPGWNRRTLLNAFEQVMWSTDVDVFVPLLPTFADRTRSKIKMEKLQCVEWDSDSEVWANTTCQLRWETIGETDHLVCSCSDTAIMAIRCNGSLESCGLKDGKFSWIVIAAAGAGLLLLLLLLLLLRRRKKKDEDDGFVQFENIATSPNAGTAYLAPSPLQRPPQRSPMQRRVSLKGVAHATVFAHRMQKLITEKKSRDPPPPKVPRRVSFKGVAQATVFTHRMHKLIAEKRLRGAPPPIPATGVAQSTRSPRTDGGSASITTRLEGAVNLGRSAAQAPLVRQVEMSSMASPAFVGSSAGGVGVQNARPQNRMASPPRPSRPAPSRNFM